MTVGIHNSNLGGLEPTQSLSFCCEHGIGLLGITDDMSKAVGVLDSIIRGQEDIWNIHRKEKDIGLENLGLPVLYIRPELWVVGYLRDQNKGSEAKNAIAITNCYVHKLLCELYSV